MTDGVKRTILVTGGSRGIGRGICLAFARSGNHIYFNYSSAGEAAAQTEKLVAEAGGTATGIQVNVASEKEVIGFVARALDETGRVDVLVNNAGITRDGLIVRMKEADWEAVLNVNLKGAFLCTKAVTKPMMKQRYGRIINVSSVVGVSGNPGQANYVASKAGIIGLTKGVARELASRGITYLPDYVANGGGLVSCAAEWYGKDIGQVPEDVRAIYDTCVNILQLATEHGITPNAAANQIAESRFRAEDGQND